MNAFLDHLDAQRAPRADVTAAPIATTSWERAIAPRARAMLAALAALAALASCAGAEEGGLPARPPEPQGSAPPPVAVADSGATAACAPSRLEPAKVRTTSGVFTGARAGSTWSWKGIPFAEPPAGPLRWRAPVPASCGAAERPATAFGPACPQIRRADDVAIGAEDCLTLNVWAPDGITDAPILFFVHGGGNITGTASDPLYDGAELAARERAVVVTMEYRLGALGFFAHPALDAERAEKVSGNYGILDQIEALRWIRTNAAAFGAAPRVLLFGESAGGQNTLVHVTSPLSKGLFEAAAVESGGVYLTTLAEAETSYAPVPATVGCSDPSRLLECLRTVPAEALARVESADGRSTARASDGDR